jgi:predicted AAA+ superfamily ATPase
MKLIERTDYLKELESVRLIPDIKVITGIRRAGKSRLMDAWHRRLPSLDPEGHVIHINFNLTEFEDLLEYHALEAFIEDHYEEGRNNYVLIDEIQMCEGFEKAVNSLHAKEKYDLYVTGSNAFLQSSDLATLFVGRTFEIPVFPFSFGEYLAYFPSQNLYGSLSDYMAAGGMAGSYLYREASQRYRYLNSDVMNALIVRDIINKYKIRNQPLLEEILDYLMDNVGNLTSIRKVTDTLSSNRTRADHKTVARYMEYLCRAFAFYPVRRYDVRGKKYLKTENKYYLADHSFRTARLGTRNMDYGHILENIVAIELLRRGYEVYAGVLYKKETDFVAIRGGEKIYIQVCNDISGEKTFDREVAPLLAIRDGYPKVLIARIYQPAWQYEGIQVIDPADWLLPIPQK